MPVKGQGKRSFLKGVIWLTLAIATACVIGFVYARSRSVANPLSQATKAYRDGQWAVAAELARQAVATRKGDLAAFRLLARAQARLGRDDAAMNIYARRLDDQALEAEDHVLIGLLHERHGRPEAAAAAWKRAFDSAQIAPSALEELARHYLQSKRWEEAIPVTERLSQQPGWEARGSMMLGTIRTRLNNMPEAAAAFGRALVADPTEVERAQNPIQLRKLIARTFLRVGHPDQARTSLRVILDHGPDAEASWLESRAYLQEGEKAKALQALAHAGNYRGENQMEPEPGLYVGEARCEKCHQGIFTDSLASRHTQSYYRGAQISTLPVPDRPLPDPEDAAVSHTFNRHDGTLTEQTRVGNQVFEAVIEYAFGTRDRYLTMVSHDAKNNYHIARLSYYDTSEKKGWDRSPLDRTHPTRAQAADFQGETIGVKDGLARCFYCHVTNPRTGHEALGPETSDRAIGCERCHGPGGNHLAALQLGFPDSAIVNPAGASPDVVTSKQCNECHILDPSFRTANLDDPGWVRSQGVGWTLSRCNTESGGAFGCVTCHDPHKSARATSTVQYEAKCLICHAAAGTSSPTDKPAAKTTHTGAVTSFRPCPVNPAKGCIECHMPRVRVDLLHLDLADHHIRVPRKKP
jgi:tetratricopeptide (TPR) repeat protein